MIGDPSMKSQERKLLDEQTLRHNQEAIKRQLAKFLDFDSTEPNAAELVNNYDWMKQFSFLDFIRDVGKHITVNYMMAKDSVKKRLSGESQQGMSFTEFSYQLVQGYDFLCLYRDKGCRLQLGGSDQWGNITRLSTELIRRTLGGEAFAPPAPSSPKLTEASSVRQRAATCGSTPAIHRPTNSISSGSMFQTPTPRNTSRSSPHSRVKRSTSL